MTFEDLHRKRLANWCQDGLHRVENATQAKDFIERVGICPLFNASPEFPDLFHAHMSDPEAKTEMKWDSPSGFVYSWRWDLGRLNAGFYGTVVAKKPTWVVWSLLPALLGALMERRTPDELFDLGLLSKEAHRLAAALEAAGGALMTGELRKAAGFPVGKELRAAYLKALDELDQRLVVAKKMSEVEGDDDMAHVLVEAVYKDATIQALQMQPVEALAELVRVYLRSAVYLEPKTFARHLRVSPELLDAALSSLCGAGVAERWEKLVVTKEEA